MNICFIVNSLFTIGGIQRCVTNLANYLVTKNFSVSIIIEKPENIDYDLYKLDKSVKLVFMKKIGIFRKLIVSWKFFLKILNEKTHIFKNNKLMLKFIYYNYHKKDLFTILNHNNYDIAVATGSYLNVLLSLYKSKKTKKVGWQHSSYESYFEEKNYEKQKKIILNMFDNLDKYIVLVDIDKKKILNNIGYNTKTIANAVSFTQKEKSNVKNKAFIAAGRYSSEKAFEDLIYLFKKFNEKNDEWILNIYGDGKEKEKLKDIITQYNLNDKVFLKPSTSEIAKEYVNSSIYCMTSKIEGFPMVLLEAMECGVPIISFELPCLNDIMSKEHGMVIKNRNMDEYVESMLKLANDYELRKKISKSQINHVKKYSIEKIGQEWIDLFDDLITFDSNETYRRD